MTLDERLDAIRQGADKRIPPDKRAIMHRATDDLRIGDHGWRHQSRQPAAGFRFEERVRAGGALIRASGEGTVGPDRVPRQLVTLLRRRAVCFAASGGYSQRTWRDNRRNHAATGGSQSVSN